MSLLLLPLLLLPFSAMVETAFHCNSISSPLEARRCEKRASLRSVSLPFLVFVCLRLSYGTLWEVRIFRAKSSSRRTASHSLLRYRSVDRRRETTTRVPDVLISFANAINHYLVHVTAAVDVAKPNGVFRESCAKTVFGRTL